MAKRSLTQHIAGRGVHYVRPVLQNHATGLVAAVYSQAEEEFALVPPLTIHSSVPEILAGVWCVTREAYIVGHADRADRETVAAAVSRTNACPYCIQVHSAMLHAASKHDLARQLLEDSEASSSAHSPLVEWALATRDPTAAILDRAPFAPEAAPSILATAIAYHYINRMVNVFLDESPMPLKIRSGALKNALGRMMGRVVGRRIVAVDAPPGRSLALLPDAAVPPEFDWAHRDPSIAGALARLAHAVEDHGRRVLPVSVRRLVEDRLAVWDGKDPGLGLQWLDRSIVPLHGPADRAAARLALLTALASYRVDASVGDTFKAHYPREADLVAVAAWASFKAVQRLSSWIAGPARQRARARGGTYESPAAGPTSRKQSSLFKGMEI